MATWTYDVTRPDESRLRGPVRAGDQLVARIENVNALCYETTVKLASSGGTGVAAAESTVVSNWKKTLEAVTPATPATPGDLAFAATMQQRYAKNSVNETLNKQLRARLSGLRQQLQRLQQAVSDDLQTNADARAALKSFLRRACDPQQVFEAPPRDLPAAADSYALRTEDLATRRALVAALLDSSRAYGIVARLNQADDALIELAGRLSSSASSLLQNADTLKAHHSGFVLARDEMRSRLGPRRLYQFAAVGEDATRMEMTIEIKGRKGTPAEGTSFSLKPMVPTRPRPRLFTTVGWMRSWIPTHQYRREVLPVLPDNDPATLDTALVTTFVDRAGGRAGVSSPVVLTHLTFTNPLTPALSLALSTGLTYRTVNDQQGLEYLAGLSISAWQRVFMTLGAHFGRSERFLPGERRLKQPISKNLTQTAAVGTEWRTGFAFTLSLGL